MNSEFKKILLNLAKLPQADQRWVLKQLTLKEQEQFTALQGSTLLRKALRFRCLPSQPAIHLDQSPELPAVCKQLREDEPLYIAIILDQGRFGWEQQFLQTCAHQEQIKEQRDTYVTALKPALKTYIFQKWQIQLSFKEQLEETHD